MSHRSKTIRPLLALGKFALGGAILAYLLYQVRQQDGFSALIEQSKDWRFLALGVVCILVSELLSFGRWFILVRALGLDFRLLDAVRLGAIAFALNFVALGSLGGDVFKAVFIARSQPGRRTAAVTTIFVDRVVGLFTFLVLASVAVMVIDVGPVESTAVTVLFRLTLICTAVGWGGFALVLILPSFGNGRWMNLVERIPVVGTVGLQLVLSLAAYRNHKLELLKAFLLSVVVDTFFIVSFFLVAAGLPMHVPTLTEHFFVVPLSLVAGSIPITPSGLGTLEAAVEALYQIVPSDVAITPGTGTIAALAHRVGMMLVAAIGVAFYVSQRTAVSAEVNRFASSQPEATRS
jgi:hypothetical protein